MEEKYKMRKSNCIGVKDAASKNFFGRPDVLADIMNAVMFDGGQVVRPGQLSSLCGEYTRIVRGGDGKYRTDNSRRDRLFEYDNGTDKVAIGLELQSGNEKKMILRIMRYDERCYEELVKLGRRRRVSSIVLSFDRNGKSCQGDLSQVFGETRAIPDKYVPNYSCVSLNVYDLAKKLDMFHCRELRDVLYLFKCSSEKRPFMDELAASRNRKRLSRDAAFVCAAFLGFDVDIEDNEKEVGMCTVVNDFRRKCIKEGKALGFKEGEAIGMEKGMEKGKKSALREFVANLLSLNFSVMEICKMTKATEETVKEIELSLEQ